MRKQMYMSSTVPGNGRMSLKVKSVIVPKSFKISRRGPHRYMSISFTNVS